MSHRACIICGGRAVEGFSRCSAHSRGSNWQHGRRPKSSYYSSRGWQDRRHRQLAEFPTCAKCGARATQADHIVNMASGGDPDGPLQSLCLDCHRQKTSREGHLARYGGSR
jgi:5-methylcytosine-specific restriction enzyme A